MKVARRFKKLTKGIVSVLLALLVMTSLGVPMSVFAEEEAATGNDIYALLYDVRNKDTNNHWSGYELVFQKGSTPDDNTDNPRRKYVKTYTYEQFGTLKRGTGTDFTYETPWHDPTETPAKLNISPTSGNDSCTRRMSHLIKKVVIKDKIAPESIAGWFMEMYAPAKIEGLEKLDTSNCIDMSHLFDGTTFNDTTGKTLDLSFFDTSNVERLDRFVYSSTIEEVNVSGLDLRKVKTLTNFIAGGWKLDAPGNLKKVNISGIDLSNVQELNGFVTYTKYIEDIDMTGINFPNAINCQNLFTGNIALKKFKFPTLFTPGSNIINSGEIRERNTDDNSSNNVSLVRLDGMFNGCTSLEEVDFENVRVNDVLLTFKDISKGTYYNQHLSTQYSSMFKDCECLTKLKNFNNVLNTWVYAYDWTFRNMFTNCRSIETLDLSKLKCNLGQGPSTFEGCSSLRYLNLGGIGLNMSEDRRAQKSSSYNRMTPDKSYYKGCDELSEIVFSPYYPRKVEGSTSLGSLDNVPGEKNWIKIENPSASDYPGYPTSNNKADPEYRDGNAEYKGYCAVGTKRSTTQLFGDFKPEYAGRWVVVSQIALRGNGGTPDTQYFDGARGLAVNYDAEALGIVDPKRNGYKFTGWFSEKANDEGVELVNDGNTPAASWSYYAHWDENKYTLILDGNGGTTVKNDETVTSFTASDNLLYSKYFELNNTMFSKEGYILSGWNTRMNGSGDEYAANDSVNKLVEIDGGSATLYAQWHKPDFVLEFDANYQGAASVPSKNYTFVEGKKTYYGALSELSRSGYTFNGWWTEAEGGTEIKSTNELLSNVPKLYAHWKENPSITFDANGGHFEGKSGNSPTFIRQYGYNQNLGVIPTPVHS